MWSSRLFRRVFIAFAAVIVVSAILFAILVSRGHEAELQAQLREQLRVSSVILGQLAMDVYESDESTTTQAQATELQRQIYRLGIETKARLTLVQNDGRVVADSDQSNLKDVQLLDNHRHRPEIQDAMEEGFGFARRFSATTEEQQFYCATRIDRNGTTLGVARASMPVHTIQDQVRQGKRRVWTFTAAVAAIALLVTSYLLSRITTPLMKLHRAVERMSAGHLGEHVEIANRDEIGLLARAFNGLSDDLLQRIDQLRERGDQLAAVLGGMVEGVIALDNRGRVMFANQAASRQFDFRTDDARGRPLLTLIRHEALHHSVKQALASGDVVNAEIERHSPTSGSLAVHVKPLPGSPCPGVVAVFYDMTRLRRLESLRQEFVANVSHELKTPLSSIKAYAETLISGAINDERHNLEFVQRIEDQANRLQSLIVDMLSLARIESGDEAYEITDVDAHEAIAICLDELRPSAQTKNIEICIEPPSETIVLRADEEAVRQILENLVNNAIKYTPSGGRVTVKWQRLQNTALIEVVDTGIGIDPQHLDRLFERFYRVDKARSRELGGTGLGLSIVKHLAQFFGGNVGVESEKGQGSTFWVRLPLSPHEDNVISANTTSLDP